jgi:membrane fusion protein, copper/silver efflux system
VRNGVEAGQQVVASGQFLIDSEATLQGVIARAASAPATAAAPAAAPAGTEHHVNGIVAAAPEGGLITLEHEPVPALKWPGMTMPFQLAQPELGKGLKAGDKVHFSFRQQDGKSVVTAIQKVSP